MRRVFALCLLALAACAPPPPTAGFRELDRTTPQLKTPRPDYPGYGTALAQQPIRWTATTLAADFTELMYFTEWGAKIDGLLRWEEPVRIALIGPELNRYRSDVTDLINRISSGAPGLDIALVDATSGTALSSRNIILRTAPRSEMNEIAPTALCFFVPFDGDWPAYVAAKKRGFRGWTGIDQLEKITIFIPAYAAPHDIRACIREEITQSLGTGNDVTRFEDSMFNDDNAYTRPTNFDLLMLRVLYDPDLATGMTEAEARPLALAALARPGAPDTGGNRRYRRTADERFQEFYDRIASATSNAEKLKWARRAMDLAKTFGPDDHRFASSAATAAIYEFVAGRSPASIRLLRTAESALAAQLGPESVRLAIVRLDLASLLILEEDPETALALLDQALPILAAYGDDLRLARALRWRAAALLRLDREAEARAAALDAIAWGKYVFGADSQMVAGWKADFDMPGAP